MIARKLLITGKVQGVGFRPFIYRLATEHTLKGWVRNRTGIVEIHVEGTADNIERFCRQVTAAAPAIAEPQIESIADDTIEHADTMRILASDQHDRPEIHIPTDFFTCADCLAELRDPTERRYRYPFINCTQCGPRYTIINKLPYDRPATSMAGFPLCQDCRREYEDPLDRRFHAQPLACPACGPALRFHDAEQDIHKTGNAITAAVESIRAGRVIAVKGIGGYHLLCSATDDQAISHLRSQKPRPDKPLALMFPERGEQGLDAVYQYIDLSADEAALLRSPARPIVLGRTKENNLSPLIAPGLDELGVMLPYSPLHYLLLDELDSPVIATSANISGEPVLTDGDEVEQRLAHVAQGFLHHDRDIVRPADDPVYRTIARRPRPIRLGRGTAPVELNLPFTLPAPVLAAGSHMKNTVALAWNDRLVISPHIGDLDSPRSRHVFAQVIEDLQALYQVTASALICDAHPGYASSRWAMNSGLPLTRVYHHEAHASALALEHWCDEDWLVFTWDGVGLGRDQTLWGGEALTGRPGSWQRAGSFVPFYLPGGEKAGREPWRSGAALCWQADVDWPGRPENIELLKAAWDKRMNCPPTTAAGRLFDAAAALTGILQNASYEGQGPVLLEHASAPLRASEPLPLSPDEKSVLRADWSGIPAHLLDDSVPVAERAAWFHSTLAHTLLCQAQEIAKQHDIKRIGLCGGVFQNRKLGDYVHDLLAHHGFDVYLPHHLPANDAAISAGQVIEYACMDH